MLHNMGVPPKLMDMRGDRTERCGMGRRNGMYTEYVSFASVGFISKALGCSCVPMISLGAPRPYSDLKSQMLRLISAHCD